MAFQNLFYIHNERKKKVKRKRFELFFFFFFFLQIVNQQSLNFDWAIES